MAEVRRATTGDLEALLVMARELHAEAPQYRDEPFEADVTRAWLRERIGAGMLVQDSVVFVAESAGAITGALVAIVVPRWFNRNRVAAELTLYIRPQHRGGRALPRLVAAYKAWAKAEGAVKATLGVSTGIHPERTVHAYGRLGFKLDGYNASTDL